MAAPTSEYTAQAGSAQWKWDWAIATCRASTVPASTVLGGGLRKWESGSEGPKKNRPTPMPAANIIATQEKRENSGSSSSRPSLMRPKRLKTR